MSKKLTYESIKNYFKEQGCELLEKEYVNYQTKMKYKCSCKNISKINFNNFEQGQRCSKCATKKRADKLKHSYEYIKNYFKEQGCELLSKVYINNNTKMKYICSCGDISEITFASFKRGRRCIKCGGTEKLTFKYVKQYFSDNGCELLEKEYINNNTKMKYRCTCGDINEIRFYNFKQGQRCKKCGIKKLSELKKHSYKYIKQYFKEHGCELLEKEYKDNRTKMKYKCSCGNISKITFHDFRQGHRCRKCSKTNHCMWCGVRYSKDTEFCSIECETEYSKMKNQPLKSFYSYRHAAKYFKKDTRTIKKWDNILYKIDKNLKEDFDGIIWKTCKLCGEKTGSSKCRSGYCKNCSKKGLGHQEAGKLFSQRYKGEGNPNYVHGKKMEHLRERSVIHSKWTKQILKERPAICQLSGRTDHLHVHHILGFSLFPKIRYEKWNGIIINRFYHIELHRQKLDLLLLPTLCSLSLQDVQELIPAYLHLPQLQLLLQIPYRKHAQHELIRVVGRYSNYPKQISLLHPQFDQSSLSLLESKLMNLEVNKTDN